MARLCLCLMKQVKKYIKGGGGCKNSGVGGRREEGAV